MMTRPALGEIAPRLLTREQAASYCGVSLSAFANWIQGGLMPGPIPQTHRWDKKAIDTFLDILSHIDDKVESSAFDQWKAKRYARRIERNSSG